MAWDTGLGKGQILWEYLPKIFILSFFFFKFCLHLKMYCLLGMNPICPGPAFLMSR